jgi:hypothetical protein
MSGLLDGIGNLVGKVGDAIGGAIDSVIHNPVGALVDVGLLYMGVPPVYAGMAAGAANAAANHGNILQGALTGGAMAGAAGFASEFAGAQGLGTVGSAAAAGAAAGATGAALTGQGLSNVVKGALSGGVMGGAIGYFQKPNGSITYTYDDGSTLTRNPDGSYTSTAAGSIPAPVFDKSTYSVDKVNLSSSWPITVDAAPGTVWTGPAGPEIVLNDGKVLPMDVYRAAIATGKPIFVDGVAIDMNLQNIAQAQGNLNNPQGIVDTYRTPGTALASVEEINTGKANYNPQAHAWETTQVSDANAGTVYHPSEGPATIGAPPGQGAGASVMNLNSTGLSDSAPGTIYQGANGPEIVLNSGKTVSLADYQNAVNSGAPIAVDGSMQTQFKVEFQGVPQYEGMPGAQPAPEGYKIAKPEDIFGPDDTHSAQNPYTQGAYLDPQTNTWYTPTGTTGQITQPINPADVGSFPSVAPVEIMQNPEHVEVNAGKGWIAYNPDGTSYGVDEQGKTFQHGAGTLSEGGGAGPQGGKTITYDDGSTVTIHNDGSVTSTPATGGGTGGGGTTPTTGPVAPTEPTVPPVDETEFPHDRGTVPPEEPTTPPEEPTTPPEEPTVNPPVVPIVPVTPPTPAPKPEYSLNWGQVPVLNTNFGLNPGWIQPVQQYQTTSPVQAQYYWGAHPFQQGPTFNPELAKQGIGAPATPWGLQQMYQQLTPEQTAALVQQQAYLQQLPGAQVAGPVAPR